MIEKVIAAFFVSWVEISTRMCGIWCKKEKELSMDANLVFFLIMSDTDGTFNFLIFMIYTQMFNLLCEKADAEYAVIDMTAYAHILDDDRRKNAELFEEAFYEKKKLDPQMQALLNSLAKTIK